MIFTFRKAYKCPYCGSKDTSWKGFRARVKDKVRLRHCNKCKRKHTTKEVIKIDGAQSNERQ